MISLLLPALIAPAVLLPALIAPARADGTVAGVVLDGEGHAPLAGVEVTAGQVQAVTGPDGTFSLSLPAGSAVLTLREPGAQSHSTDVAVIDEATTEVLVTLFDDDREPVVTVETPLAQFQAGATDLGDLPTGTLQGQVVDERGKAVSGARVFVRGVAVEATSGADGRFELVLPVGTHELSVLRSGFASQAVSDVVVGEDQPGAVTIELVEAGLALEDLVVKVPRISGGTATLLAERQNVGELVDSVSAEQMSRRGDSSAAAALTRVTGLTVVGGRYVFVRGLGERYSATLLNGASLPSPEPERRVVPLDLFPTALLDSVVIQKTFSPSMPAEFGGGVVRLRTRGIPEKPLLSIKLSGGATQGTTFVEGPMADGGPTDWLGWDNGYRDLPVLVQKASEEAPLVQRDNLPRSVGYTPEELEVFGEAMPNRWGLTSGTAMPDFGLSMVAGRGFRNDHTFHFGVLGGMTFDNGWDHEQYTSTYYGQEGAGIRVLNQYEFDDLSNEVGIGAILEAAAEYGDDHSIQSTTLLTRDSENLAREYIGDNHDIGTAIRVQRIRWVERQLFTEQLSGSHRFPLLMGAGFDWRYGWALANRLEPDRRDILMQPTADGDWYMRTQAGGNSIFTSALDDVTRDLGADVVVPLGDDEDETGLFGGELRAGASIVRRERNVDSRRFVYSLKTSGDAADTEFLINDPHDIFTADSIGPGLLQFQENTQATDNYTATQDLDAWFLQADLRLPARISAIGGVRHEASSQVVETFQLFQPDLTPVVADLATSDYLPALTVTKVVSPVDADRTMQVRLGYGQTVSRPDFRELSPAVFNDVVGGGEIGGNPDLERALINNYDARWEWYLAADESLSLGGFYKHFDKPIETVLVVGEARQITFDNARSADNLGVEIEWRKALGIGESAFLDELYLSGNIALIRSTVDLSDLDGAQSSDIRPLQGQSPWVLNLQLSYEGADAPWGATLLYNAFGPRISEVGRLGLPDTVEEPVHRVDAVGSWQFAPGWRLSAGAKNLLDSPSVFTMGDLPVSEVRHGRSASLGLSWNL